MTNIYIYIYIYILPYSQVFFFAGKQASASNLKLLCLKYKKFIMYDALLRPDILPVKLRKDRV